MLLKTFRNYGLLAAVFLLIGCGTLGTYNPATGRQELIFIPTNEEVAMGQKMHQQILSQYKLSTQPDQVNRVQRIGQRLAQVSERQDYTYQFFVLEDKGLNAFTIPGGRVYIFTGLLDKLTSDDQVAAVLGHEIGHCSGRHTIKKFQASVGYNLIGNIVLNELGSGQQAGRLVAMSADKLMQLVFSAYGRQDEFEADHIGLRYLDWAGFQQRGMVEAFDILEKNSEGSSVPLILRTHPYIKDRIAAIEQEIKK